MRVVLHGVADYVGNFVESAVVQCLHGMQYAALHWFQSVLNVGDGAFQNHIAGIFKIPFAEHSRQNGLAVRGCSGSVCQFLFVILHHKHKNNNFIFLWQIL